MIHAMPYVNAIIYTLSMNWNTFYRKKKYFPFPSTGMCVSYAVDRYNWSFQVAQLAFNSYI